mmetsp:Transcript_1839/g.3717  ORF Transcript_1839/g.3717 Transcript_1839/m.3717 type:complete len:388 (-) Transcript_1839:462-1625(-)|eukprot:CAMPEP_0118922464 /NCGR_PEP_ID=MMETSP1169-20130426/1380_1 /TAXON_ID=36882 /ORGANISM="Pyramimonas obovata, Strain CCMP722" /LENGTH=387 /DNA_ID=CAMNT_0006863335 /DNA_START=146 /DNA_END=1309 /DNA_ORIENTATION=+
MASQEDIAPPEAKKAKIGDPEIAACANEALKIDQERNQGDANEQGGEEGEQGEEQGRPGGRRRTSRLREQNSRAQRRYRERQKLQKEQMEKELSSLRSTASRLAAATEEKDKLEKKVALMEKRLKEQQEEVGSLQQPAHGQSRPSGSSAVDKIGRAVIEASHLQLQWVQQVHKLGAALAGPQADEAGLNEVVDRGCALFHELLQSIPQAGDIQSTQALATNPQAPLWLRCLAQTETIAPSSFASEEEALHWKQVAVRMSLNSEQCVQLVRMREEVVEELKKIFASRASLISHLQLLKSKWKVNMQAVRTIEAKLALLQMICQEGVLLLEEVVKNLSSEQQAMNSITRKYTSKVLLPSETVRFMVESRPHPADALQLAHVYAGATVTQ